MLRAMLLVLLTNLVVFSAAAGEELPTKLDAPRSVQQLEREHAADPEYLARRDADGMTILHRTCERGDVEVVRRMLELGADAKQSGQRGITPLHAVMSGAYRDAMERSMKPRGVAGEWSVEKARARERETRGQGDPERGPMQFAEVTRLLLSKGADPGAKATDGFTPLHLAASAGRADLASLLIEARVDVNAVAKPRASLPSTPLAAAAGSGEIETVRLLLDAGAHPAKVPEESRRYFLNLAMGSVEVFRLLLNRGLELPPDAMKVAARKQNVDVIEEIKRRQQAQPANARMDQNALDQALYTAVKADEGPGEAEDTRVRTLRSLLEAGASASAPEGTGEALVYAVSRGHEQVAKLLRERGAKVDWARLKDDDHHPSKLAYGALFMGKPERINLLEDLGMPLDVLGASALGREERLRELVKQTPAVAKGGFGANAMYFAAREGQTGCVRLLLDAGADPNERMPSWDTPDIGPRPLDGAAARGHVDTVRLLLDRGADSKLMTLDDDDWSKVKPEIRRMLGRGP